MQFSAGNAKLQSDLLTSTIAGNERCTNKTPMKFLLSLTLGILLFAVPLCAQDGAAEAFARAEQLYTKNKYSPARISFQQFIRNYPEETRLVAYANFNLGEIYYGNGDLGPARKAFQAVLQSEYEEAPSYESYAENPYLDLKHHASSYLYEMARKEERYEEALTYFSLADTLYRMSYMCGNAYQEDRIANAVTYAKLYRKAGRSEEALPHLLRASLLNYSADEGPAVRALQRFLRSRPSYLPQLETALAAATYTPLDSFTGELNFTFLGEDLTFSVRYRYLEVEEPSREEVIDFFRSTGFYAAVKQ